MSVPWAGAGPDWLGDTAWRVESGARQCRRVIGLGREDLKRFEHTTNHIAAGAFRASMRIEARDPLECCPSDGSFVIG